MMKDKFKKSHYENHPKIKTITLEKLDLLGYDEKDQLYWNGKPVKIQKKLTLTYWQGSIAFVAACGTLLSGVVALLEYLK